MTISGLGYNSFIPYGNRARIKYAEENVPVNNDVSNNDISEDSADKSSGYAEPKDGQVKSPKILTDEQLEDFAFDFKNGKEFSMVGEDSDINSLDIPQNIYDMKKDDLLDKYRFFVGTDNNNAVAFISEDGAVVRK